MKKIEGTQEVLWNLNVFSVAEDYGDFLGLCCEGSMTCLPLKAVSYSLFPDVQSLHYAHTHIFCLWPKKRPFVDVKLPPENKQIT